MKSRTANRQNGGSEKGTCMLIHAVISIDRNVIKKEAMKVIKYGLCGM